jgi:hypothetical protein
LPISTAITASAFREASRTASRCWSGRCSLLADGAPPERREIAIRTAFRGPGARDAIELVTRATTDGRYVVDAALERPERGTTLMRYVFVLTYRQTTQVAAPAGRRSIGDLDPLVARQVGVVGEQRLAAPRPVDRANRSSASPNSPRMPRTTLARSVDSSQGP